MFLIGKKRAGYRPTGRAKLRTVSDGGSGGGSGGGRHWFEDVADHLGGAYLRYSFTKGTHQEVDFLVGALGLAPGVRVLDIGCGPGRHAHALAARGFEVVGVDLSERFIALARENTPAGASVTFERADARSLEYGFEFDAVISLCQGAFGLSGGDDTAARPSRMLVVSRARPARVTHESVGPGSASGPAASPPILR
jgi:SAM-dependent methyltransferase